MPSIPLLDDSRIAALLRSPEAVHAFPFLRTPPNHPRVGKSCCGGRGSVPRPDYNSLKATIANLPGEQQKKLLGLLGLSEARIIYSAGQGNISQTLG